MMRVPLNMMVFNDIFNKIQSKYYSPGDPLPTEQEMEKIYGTSRAPIRQALGKLETEGLIVRKPGKGTFVAHNEITGPWMALGGFGREFSLKWNQITCKTLSVETIKAAGEVAHHLSLSPVDDVVRTSRLRFVNEVPVCYLHHYTTHLDPEVIKSAGDIPLMRNFLIEKSGIEIEYVSEEISAIRADKSLADVLNVEEGYPVCQILRVSYDQNFTPVELVKYFTRSEEWKYRVMYSKDSNESVL
jgi:GntR family transcriptional regulator